jgi:16S rRNA (cytidine1402-2'-O)-methyltransferase
MGILYIVATPIGNLEDITIRAIKILLTVPIVACEDTRHTGQLLKILEEKYGANILDKQKNRKLISVRDWNEAQMVDKVIEEVKTADVALVSDAGTPLLSDPGFKVVRAARVAGIKVVPIPGAFAGAVAASAAGLPTNKIMFWGFLPKKWELLPEMTHVIYEAPPRVSKTCEEIKNRYPSAKIVLARELTKIYEAFENWDGQKTMGEITLLVYIGKEISASHGDGDGNLK